MMLSFKPHHKHRADASYSMRCIYELATQQTDHQLGGKISNGKNFNNGFD